MQALVMTMIVVASLTVYAAIMLRLPGFAKLAPELMTAIIIPYIIAAGSKQRFQYVHPKYWILFGALALSLICGIVVNDVETGPIVTGIRSYLRAIPFFFLAATFDFTEDNLRKQFRLLLLIGLIQIPIAAWQRWSLWQQGRFTGDLVYGTFGDSGVLSIFMICCVLVLVGLMQRDRISKLQFTVLFFLLLIPTTINETKATVLMLPLGLLTALVVGAAPGRRLQVVGIAATLLVSFGAIFIPVYNVMQTNNPYAKDITQFFTDKEEFDRYMSYKHAGVGTSEQVGRADALRIPVEYVSRDPVTFVFGLGSGNVSETSLGKQFSGHYQGIFHRITITGFSTFLLELGFLGVGLIFLLHWILFKDAVFVARNDSSLFGALAIGWAGVSALIAICNFYTNIQFFEALSFVFWYMSGLFAAKRMRMARDATVSDAGPTLSDRPIAWHSARHASRLEETT